MVTADAGAGLLTMCITPVAVGIVGGHLVRKRMRQDRREVARTNETEESEVAEQPVNVVPTGRTALRATGGDRARETRVSTAAARGGNGVADDS